MSKSNPIPASAAEVREWARAHKSSIPEHGLASVFGKNGDGKVRGRLNPAVAQAFTKATGRPYTEKSVAEGRSMTLPLVRKNAKGALLKRPEAFTVAEVRRLAGAPAMGRLSSKHIATACEAVQAERGW